MMRIARSIIAGALTATLAVPALAQTVTLRVSHYLPPTAMPVPAWETWWKSMEADAKGALKIQVFPAGQLGKAQDQYDMVRDGIADMAWAVPGFSPGRFPIFSALELPMTVSNAAEGVFAFDQWYRKHVAREMGDIHYCMAQTAPISFLSMTSKEVMSPQDVKGLRVRPTSALIGRYFANMGASIVQVSASEAKQAFDRGVIDAITFPLRSLIQFNLHTATKVHMDLPIITAPSAWVINKKKYDSLPAPVKAVIDSHCVSEWSRRTIKVWEDFDAEGRAELTKLGNKIYPISTEARAKWKEAADAMHGEWIKDVEKTGINGRVELDDLLRRLRDRKAGS